MERLAKFPSDENGAILITGLVLLALLTFLGIATMQATVLQEKMAGNLQQQNQAFQLAETGLRDGEAWLQEAGSLPDFDNTGGLYTPAALTYPPHWETVDWENPEKLRLYRGTGLIESLRPRYIIEHLADLAIYTGDSQALKPEPDERNHMYRITSRGRSPNGKSLVMLQSTYLH